MNQKIMNNGKFYIGILNNENNSLGIGKDSNYNNFVYIKALNLDKNNLDDMDITTIRLFASDCPESIRSKFSSMDQQELSQELSDKVFIFNILCSQKGIVNQYKAINVTIRKKPSMLTTEDKFVGIPCFDDQELLEKAIKSRSELNFNFMSTINDENPIVMLMGESINNIIIYYNLPFESENSGIVFNKENGEYAEIEAYDASSEKVNSCITFSQSNNGNRIAYIPENMINISGLNKISENVNYLDWSDVDPQHFEERGQEKAKDENENQIDEVKFIKHFINVVENKYGLTFKYSDLINFHNSVKSNVLTVLAGLSGTGKSKITEVYADALGILNDQQYKMISVRPFWQDDADLLGFVDSTSNNYHPGDTELIETIIQANKNKDKLYIVVFDEMNIARIEHYFSQFISVLERSSKERYITLYNPSLEPRLYNSDRYPSKILVPENIRFIGTMNLDESTFQISNRLLDRANIIDFEILPFSQRKEKDENKLKESITVSFVDYKKFLNNGAGLSDRELKFFEKLHTVISSSLPGAGLSWRILKNIETFIKNSPQLNIFDRKLALDLQVAGRILPKIRGNEEMIESLISSDNEQSIESIFDEFSDLSEFNESREVLKQKSQELHVNGFAR